MKAVAEPRRRKGKRGVVRAICLHLEERDQIRLTSELGIGTTTTVTGCVVVDPGVWSRRVRPARSDRDVPPRRAGGRVKEEHGRSPGGPLE
jgi:hypothetical protein